MLLYVLEKDKQLELIDIIYKKKTNGKYTQLDYHISFPVILWLTI